MEQAGSYYIFCGGRNTNMTYRQAPFYMRESYVQLGELEFVNFVVYNKWEVDDLNVRVPTEGKNDDSWDSFYEELKCVLEHSSITWEISVQKYEEVIFLDWK